MDVATWKRNIEVNLNGPFYVTLEALDARIPELLARIGPDDLLLVCADHGNDPTWTGTDHTRERVPVLCHGLGPRALGHLAFADVAASIAAHLSIPSRPPGKSFL